MSVRIRPRIFTAPLIALSLSAACPAQDSDVFIYGATPAGIAAAVTAAEHGYSVRIVESTPVPGGMITGGLSASDVAIKEAIGGLAAKFFRDAGAVYNQPKAERFEPHVALRIFRSWLAHEKIELHLNDTLTSAKTIDGRIASVLTASGNAWRAEQFIDASYEGDLMALAGVSFTYGREGVSTYGETYAGVKDEVFEKQFTVQVNPFDKDGNLLPEIQDRPMAPIGHGDDRIQAYNYRLCLTDVKENQIPFYKPEGYDPFRFELLARWLELVPIYRREHVLMFLPIHQGRKIDLNHAGPMSTDFIGGNWDYPTATEARREEIRLAHRRYTEGLLYFLANDLRIPEQIRLDVARYGYAKDEFVETGNWPHQLYVREARRMLGRYILTEKDVLEDITKPDAIGLGSHRIESHPVQRVVRLKTFAYNKGDMNVRVPMTPYQIPYRCLTPLASECTNLLVPVCISASHIGYSAIRMEPQYMIMGQSAGEAAVMALEASIPVQQVPVPELQQRLKRQGQRLNW